MNSFTPLRWPLFESNIKTVVRELQRDLLKYLLIENVTINGPTIINHSLGRDILGWFIIDKDANADVWKESSDSKTLTLNSTGTVTIKILVF